MLDMTPKGPPPTLGELAREVEDVRVTCLDCRHEGTVKLARLAFLAGLDAPFPRVAAKFKCSACGSAKVHARPEWRLK